MKEVGAYEKVEKKREKLPGITDEERAHSYWHKWLDGEARIDLAQNPQCEIAIVVPVYNEKPERILKQIDSLKQQEGVNLSQFEIIYVVNNDFLTDDTRSMEIRAANQAVIDMLRRESELNIFVIDKSSPGNEIEHCNVGKARNRGVAEASLRFHEKGKNGILVQTDADTYFEDRKFLSKLRTMLTEDPDIIGIAGGLIFEFNPDTTDPDELAILRKKVDMFVLKRKWGNLVSFLEDPENATQSSPNNFYGANMISRSYPSAVIGGLIDANAGEDPQFGRDLEAHGNLRGEKVIAARKELTAVTALRSSDRTAASFKKDFDQIDPERPFLMPNPFALESLSEFRARIHGYISSINRDGLKSILTDQRGKLVVPEVAFDELIQHIEQHGLSETDEFYKRWKAVYLNHVNITEWLFDLHYPPILLTEENYLRLLEKVRQHPRGQQVIDNMESVTLRM